MIIHIAGGVAPYAVLTTQAYGRFSDNVLFLLPGTTTVNFIPFGSFSILSLSSFPPYQSPTAFFFWICTALSQLWKYTSCRVRADLFEFIRVKLPHYSKVCIPQSSPLPHSSSPPFFLLLFSLPLSADYDITEILLELVECNSFFNQ